MNGAIKSKAAIIVAIITGLTAIVFVTQAFFSPEATGSDRIRDYVESLSAPDVEWHTDPMYGFSLRLPKDFIISNLPQDPGEAIIAEHPTLNLGLETFITPFDGEGPLTADTIQQLIPSLIMNQIVETELEDGTAAVRFASDDPALGETRQIWFLHDGNLFQVIMYSDNIEWLDAWVRKLPQDWKFEQPQTL